jgi:hypothetical protein
MYISRYRECASKQRSPLLKIAMHTSRTRKVIAAELSIGDTEGKFALCLDDEVLLTPQGAEVVHPSKELIRHIISEFDVQGTLKISRRKITEPKFFGGYTLLGIQKAFIEHRKEELSTNFDKILLADPTFYLCAGPERVEQYARWEPIMQYLSHKNTFIADPTRHLRLPSLPQAFGFADFGLTEDERIEMAPSCGFTEDFRATIQAEYQGLSVEKRTVTMSLCEIHEGVVLLPMLLSLGRCSPDQYASGVMAARSILAEVFGDVATKDHREMFIGLRDDARTALEYIRLSRRGPLAEISAPETTCREFKSTLRWNIKAERFDDVITHSALKTIAAFFNSSGGALFIGVNDEGKPIGLELDRFPNVDKFALHLNNLVKESMGATVAPMLDVTFPVVYDVRICRIAIPQSPFPIYLNYNREEEFFVRSGPSTTKLAPRDLVSYISEHFKT